jgi:hypothetical protein
VKKLILACSFLIAVSALGFGLGDATGGGEIDTTKADQLIAQIDEIVTNFEDCTARLDAANEAVNAVCAAHGISDVLGDPAATAAIAADLNDDERATLAEALESVSEVPEILTSLGDDIPAVIEKIPDVMTNLTDQISENPTKAAGLKDLQGKLTEGQTKLGEIAPAASETATSANDLSTTVSALL